MANEKEIAVILSLKDQMSKEMDKTKQNVMAGAKIMGTALTAMSVAGVAAIVDLAKAAGLQELAEVKLSQAMKQVGKYSNEAFNHLKDYATALQKTTTFGDEAIMSVEEMLMRFGAEGPILDKLTKATLDLAAAKGMDLAAAADLVSKSVGSSTNALTRYGIVVEGDVGSTERMQMAVDNITKLFGGAAQAQATTYLGRLEQLGNRFGDLKETIGKALIPTMNKLINFVNKIIERLENLSPKTVDLIAKILLWGTAIAGVLGPMLLFIGFLPAIVTGMASVTVAITAAWMALSGPVGLVIALGAAVVAWAEFAQMTATADNQSNIAIKTKAGLVAEMKHENNMLIRQRSSLDKYSGAYERATEKIKQQEKAIASLTIEARIEAGQLNNTTDALDKNSGMAGVAQLSYDQLAQSVTIAGQRLAADRDTMTGMAQIMGDHADGWDIIQKATEGVVAVMGDHIVKLSEVGNGMVLMGEQGEDLGEKVKIMTEANAAAFINMAQKMFESGGTLKSTFSTVIDGVSRMFDPITGAAIQLGGAIIGKLIWGNKSEKKQEVIDENVKLINNYLSRIKTNWGQFAVSLATTMAEALQLPELTGGFNSFLKSMTANFKKEITNMMTASLLKSQPVQLYLSNIADMLSRIPGEIAAGYDISQTTAGIGDMVKILANYLAPIFELFSKAMTPFDIRIASIPGMAAGGTILPRPGGTIVRVGESGETEHIIPASKMGGSSITININAGTLVGDRVSISKLVREFIAPELSRLKMKTGEAF